MSLQQNASAAPDGDRDTTYSPNLPVPHARRVLSLRDSFALWFSLGIGLLVLQAGALLVPGLSLPHALAAILVGTVLGVVLLGGAGVIGSDTGLAAMASLGTTLGARGTSIAAVLNAIQLTGWGAFEIIVMRDSADALSKQAFGWSMPVIWTLAFGALATLLAIAGPLSFVRKFLRSWGLWLLLAGALWLTWNLLSRYSFAELWRRPGTGAMSFGAGVDLVIAMPLSWLPLIADYTRFGRRSSEVFRGTVFGYGIANLWFYALGAAYGLAAGGGDTMLTTSLAAAGGGLALLLVLIDEADNAFADVHSAAVSTGTLFSRATITKLSLAFGVLSTLIALFVPMGRYQNFLFLIGSVFAPLFGVVLADHFIVRRRRTTLLRVAGADASAAGATGPRVGSPTVGSFAQSWQIAAMLAWVVGIAVYQGFSNWLPDVGATLPALVIAGLCYLVFRRLPGMAGGTRFARKS
ncbi:MAG: putative hydroxymethylpyrimidine transporter CytX [Janthinobacterium lividum]